MVKTVDRPVAFAEIQRIIAGRVPRGSGFLTTRPARIGPAVFCCGPTVGVLGAPTGPGTGWTGCPTEESVAIPPYVPPVDCPEDPCQQTIVRRGIQDALDGPGAPLVHVEISAQQEPDRESRRSPGTPKGGAVVVAGGSAASLAAAAALRMGVGGVPGPAAIGLAAVVNLGSTFALLVGTVAVVNGSASVTGTGTKFTTAVAMGSIITFASQVGVNYAVLSVTSDTALTLTAVYTGVGNVATTASVTPGAVPTAVFSFTAPDARLLIAKSLLITSSDASIWNSTQFSVEVSGAQELLLSNLTPGDEFPINLFVQPGGTITLKAACLDATLAAILGIRFDTWTKAVVTIDGSVSVLSLGRDPARRRA